MITEHGISVASWVSIDGDCALTCEVGGELAEFEFGKGAGALHLSADEDGLERLAKVATEALTRLQAIPVGEEVCFTVTA